MGAKVLMALILQGVYSFFLKRVLHKGPYVYSSFLMQAIVVVYINKYTGTLNNTPTSKDTSSNFLGAYWVNITIYIKGLFDDKFTIL
jgi:hypothetical protein